MFKEKLPKQEKEKTKEELLEEFKASLDKYGVEAGLFISPKSSIIKL